MRVRHKIPNVFSLSMMDVLCCALGCVILLWLLGAKQAEEETNDLRDKADAADSRGAQMLEEANAKNAALLTEANNANVKTAAQLADAKSANAKLDKRVRGLI